jgi:hypothetical protein
MSTIAENAEHARRVTRDGSPPAYVSMIDDTAFAMVLMPSVIELHVHR